MKNRSWRLQNHEKWGPGGDSEAIGAQGVSRDQLRRWDWTRMTPFGLPFGRHFRLKTVLFGIDFHTNFRKAFLEDVDVFRTSVSWLLGSKTVSETEKAKTWKTYVLHKENLCFGGSGLLFFGLKTIKKRSRNRRRNRRGLFFWFSWISGSILSSNIEKFSPRTLLNPISISDPVREPKHKPWRLGARLVSLTWTRRPVFNEL
jgi:hypothetical protein